ncbi:MAG: T9SS type A sorting domain-containing protein [Saprospiraceae bacterium]|nr:T9SS type A sorting domain-containing protein [Saprospiraceae bacterium]
MNDSINRLHHDFAIKPNGNIIALAWEYKNTDACIAAGRDTSTLAQGVLWPDWVFELDPFQDSIVWEWHVWDHLVQDFDSTKANYGVVADNPYKIDLNYGRPDGHPDWHHGNALDYNHELNQIMISIPYFDEIWIIDRSTSSAQAATSSGGFSNRGGDLMFRWGNPVTYGAGDSSHQQLFFQHDAQWIDDFLDFSHPYYNRIAVFNNRVGANYSTANVINPGWEMYEHKYLEDPATGRFIPEEVDLTLLHPDTFPLYSTGLSGVQFLPNGNVLLNAGRFGYAFEMTPDNQIVWEYVTPLRAGVPVAQGEMLTVNNNLTFRVKRYPADFKAFEGKDLSAKFYIEQNPDTTFCALLTSVEQIMIDEAFKIYPNPADDRITVEWDGMKYAQLEIYTLQGQLLNSVSASGGRKYLDTRSYQNGIYLVAVRTENTFYTKPIVIQH